MYDETREDTNTSIVRDAVEISSYSLPIWGGIGASILIGDYSPLFILFPLAGLCHGVARGPDSREHRYQ